MTTFRRGAAMLAAGFMVVGGAGAAVAQPVDDKTNQAGYWADLLMDPEGPYAEEGFVDVECFKLDGEQFFELVGPPVSVGSCFDYAYFDENGLADCD